MLSSASLPVSAAAESQCGRGRQPEIEVSGHFDRVLTEDKPSMVCMDQVMDRLYLGGIAGPFDPSYLHERGVTHILSLMERPLPEQLVADFKYKFVYALDLYDTDLLQDLEDCLSFVEDGRQHGAVLVHCQAGASRSATVVMAYVMRVLHLTQQEALAFVQTHRPIVSPNEGFQRQLELFEVMGCHVDQTHEEFRRYMLSKMAVRSKSGFGDSELPSNIYRSQSSQSPSDSVYKCRKCRRVLFFSDALVAHNKGQGESAFDWRSRLPASHTHNNNNNDSSGDEDDVKDEDEDIKGEKCEVSLFIEPIEWMRGQIETVEGKLACPKCKAKLGSFVWYGERCPCGAWVAPAFHVQTSKVDAMRPQTSVTPTMRVATPITATYQRQATPTMRVATPLDPTPQRQATPTMRVATPLDPTAQRQATPPSLSHSQHPPPPAPDIVSGD